MCPSCKSWFNHVTSLVKWHLFSNFLHEHRAFWTWTYNCHIAFQDIDELWKFIQACFPDKLPNSGFLLSVWQHLVAYDSRVEVHLKHHSVAYLVLCHELLLSLLGIHIHASEFVHLELSAVSADSLL